MSDDALHSDPVLEAMSGRAQKEAVRDAAAAVVALRAKGYDHIIVRVVRIVENNGLAAVPGATVVHSEDAMLPGLPMEASSLRSIADRFDAAFAKHGTHEAESGYTEDASERYGELAGEPEASR